MILGFTGTRRGMTDAQAAAVAGILSDRWAGFHHGDCVGSDAEAHALARAAGVAVTLHPPTVATHRAFCDGATFELAPLPYLARNAAIVDVCDLLVACPAEMVEQRRGGTWWTWRHAGRLRVRRMLVLPDGTTGLVEYRPN